MFILFGLFILSCSLMHIFGIYTLWHPVYWLEGWVKAACAVISVVTAVVLWKLYPALLKVPTVTLYQINEAKLAEAQEISKLGHWSYDLETGTILWSNEIFKMFGLDPKERVPSFESQKTLFSSASWEELKKSIEACIEKQEPYRLELVAKRYNGKSFHILAAGRPTEVRNGRTVSIAGIVQDISELKHLEHTRDEHEQRFQNAFQASASGFALVGLDGSWLEVNESLCKIVGYSREELLELTFQKITHPDDLDKDISLLEELRTGKIPFYQMEKRYIRKDGRVVWIELSVSAVRQRNGKVKYYVSQITDIHARKMAELEKSAYQRELERSNEELNHFAYVASHDLKSPPTRYPKSGQVDFRRLSG